MNQNTYIELLPNGWFEMKSFIRAQDYVNIINLNIMMYKNIYQ